MTTSKQIVQYLGLCFAISWISWFTIVIGNHNGYFPIGSVSQTVLWMIGGFGPAISIVILKFMWGSFRSIKDVLRYIFFSKSLTRFLIVLTAAFLWRGIILSIFATRNEQVPLSLLPLYFLYCSIIAGGFEELGWRGFLQPIIQKKFSFVLATIIVSVIWMCWHIPLFFIEGTSQSQMSIVSFSLLGLVTSLTLALIYNLTENVFACLLFHGWTNALFSIFIIIPSVGIVVAFVCEVILDIVLFIIVKKKKYITLK